MKKKSRLLKDSAVAMLFVLYILGILITATFIGYAFSVILCSTIAFITVVVRRYISSFNPTHKRCLTHIGKNRFVVTGLCVNCNEMKEIRAINNCSCDNKLIDDVDQRIWDFSVEKWKTKKEVQSEINNQIQ